VLARHSAGEAAPDEAAAVERWLDANPQEAAAVAALDRASKSLALVTPPDLDVEAALVRMKGRMHEPDVRPIQRPKTPGVELPRRTPAWRTATAIIGLAAAAGIVAIVVSNRRGPDSGGSVTPPPPVPRVYTTGVGGRDSITLADGSRIVLGPASRLTVPAAFNGTTRAVELQGVAYFDVVHDAAKPFSVRDRDALITDLGTRFSVQDDADGTVHVAVTEGKVELRSAGAAASSSITLAVGDRGVLDPGGKARRVRDGATADDLAWMRGQLVFRDAPISHVATMLQRWYGIDLRVDSALEHRTVNTPASAGESAKHVVDVIAIILGARVEQKGDTFFLHSARSRAAPP
jgi:transmembrane sensor